MSDALAGLQDRTFAAGSWLRVEAERLLSYTAEGAL
jgi:hypothetical protein